jgi:hypothetical protein
VEGDVVLADEVHELGGVRIRGLARDVDVVGRRDPVAAPQLGLPRDVARPLDRRGHVADGRVEPDVEHLVAHVAQRVSVEVALGKRHAPGQITRDRPRPQALALDELVEHHRADVRLEARPDPAQVVGEEAAVGALDAGEVARDRLHVELELPGRAQLELVAAVVGVDRVDEPRRVQPAAALGALVAARRAVAADVAGAAHVAVGQEAPELARVELLDVLPLEVAVAQQPQEELLAQRVVRLAVRRAREVVEGDREALEERADLAVPAVDVGLVGLALALGVDGDGHAVLVGAADVDHARVDAAQRLHAQAAQQALVAHEEVGRQVGARDVPEVQRPVRVGQRRGDDERPARGRRRARG